jgi:predicted phage tail protein
MAENTLFSTEAGSIRVSGRIPAGLNIAQWNGLIGELLGVAFVRPFIMAAGAFVFILGACLIAISSLTTSYGLLSVADTQIDAINLGLKLALIGVILSPVGAAILAYGIGASPPKETQEEELAPNSVPPVSS